METTTQLIIIMVLLELMEASLQRASTVEKMTEKLYFYYKKSIFIFFMIHPTLYFTLFVAFYLNIINIYIICILLIKTFDIFFKIELIRQRYIRKDMDKELELMLNLKMSPLMGFLGMFMYVPLLFMAIFY